MSKQITEKSKAVYEFLVEKNKETVLKGNKANPNCYAVYFDKKNEVSVLPIPLVGLQNEAERKLLLEAMAEILKREKVKVKMFIIVAQVRMSKPEDENIKEVLMLSARDCFENVNYQILELKPGLANIIEFSDITPRGSRGWRKISVKDGVKVIDDTLMDAVWKQYKKSVS